MYMFMHAKSAILLQLTESSICLALHECTENNGAKKQ